MSALTRPCTMLRATASMSENKEHKFVKRAASDAKRVSRAFEHIKKDSERRREELKINVNSIITEIDKIARDDTDKLVTMFQEHDGMSEDELDTFVEIDNIISFRE